MTDLGLVERVAAQYYESPYSDGEPQTVKWADAHPDDRAYWRGVVSAITDLLDEYRRPAHVGTIDPATLAQLDTHDAQAREAAEQ